MRYQGGKFYEGRWIADELSRLREGRPYWEPFCGACGVLRHVKEGPRFASDVRPDLILMWQALLDGWEPPEIVSEELYESLRHDVPSALRSFVGFGCSYAGKWFDGYARDADGKNYAAASRRVVLARAREVAGTEFSIGSYDSFPEVRGCLIYCDPPYEGLKPFRGCPKFDHFSFWDRVRTWSGGNVVVVSSFQAPADFEVISSMETRTTTRTHGHGGMAQAQGVVERLFMWSR